MGLVSKTESNAASPTDGKLARTQAATTYAVVIPAWNEAEHIEATLQAIIKAQTQVRYTGQIIVVDNNSTDNTATIASAAGATVVFEPVNQIARARNTGAAAADADFLVFVDADTIISGPLLQQSLDAMARGDVIGGGSTVGFDSSLRGIPGLLASFWNWWSVRIKAAAGCYLFCTTAAFRSVGGFDEKQYAAEELHLSKALRKLGKAHQQRFIILTDHPVITSDRKVSWYSTRQKVKQLLLLLIPGSTRSKKMCTMWYDRSNITAPSPPQKKPINQTDKKTDKINNK